VRPQAKSPRKTREITPDMQIIEVSATEFECEDETLAVIECKCSDLKESRVAEAIRQVEAYAYCLHYPDTGPSRRVSAAGVLIWTPSDMVFDVRARLGHLSGSYSFHRAICSKETAESRLKSAISNLTGARPRPGYYCSVCQAVEARAKRA